MTDQGCGFCKEKLARLLEPFFTTKKQGMGIGLSICKTSIEAHGGLPQRIVPIELRQGFMTAGVIPRPHPPRDLTASFRSTWGPAEFVREDALASCLVERVQLQFQILVTGRHPGVSDSHALSFSVWHQILDTHIKSEETRRTNRERFSRTLK